MNLLIPSRAPFGQSSRLAHETIIHNIKVSEALIAFSLGPLNCNIFIRHTKMRIDDLVGASVYWLQDAIMSST